MDIDITMDRELGIGKGFKVLNPADGHRGGNRLWFGTCATCGEQVTNSVLNGVWEHRITTYEEYWVINGVKGTFPNHSSSYRVDYCPTSVGEVHTTEIRVKEIS